MIEITESDAMKYAAAMSTYAAVTEGKKWYICDECGEEKPCILIVDKYSPMPDHCPYRGVSEADWTE